MRTYSEQKELLRVICNQCQKELPVRNGRIEEGCFHGNVRFGYFSRKDGIQQSFDLCEDCYDKWIAGFEIPAETSEVTEML